MIDYPRYAARQFLRPMYTPHKRFRSARFTGIFRRSRY